jgi:hypothetical protein
VSIIRDIPKTSREFIRIALRHEGRAVRVDVRVFELHQKAPPASTCRGFSLRADILGEVIAALVAAQAAIEGEARDA